MATMRIFLLLCIVIGWCKPAHAGIIVKTEETIAEGLILVSAEFGLFEQGADGTVTIEPVDTIPLIEGKAYGWRLRFRTVREGVALREELELPVAPKAWSGPVGDGGFKVSPDGRTGITEIDAELNKGELMNAWKVAAGDPAGNYVLRLSIAGKLVRTFKFKIVPPK